MTIRSGGSYLLRGGKRVLVARSGPGGNVSPDGTWPLDKNEEVSQAPQSDSLAEVISKPPAVVGESSAANVKKEKADAHKATNAASRP